MALFVGRISNQVRTRDINDLFSKYGHLKRCDIKGTFAFVTYEDERDGEDALEKLQGYDLLGSRINIEWAKGSGRYVNRYDRDRRHRHGGSPHRRRRSHSRERHSGSKRQRSRSKSRSRSRDKKKRHKRSRSRSHDKSRERSKDAEDNNVKERGKSKSKSRSRSKERKRRERSLSSGGGDKSPRTDQKETTKPHTSPSNREAGGDPEKKDV